MSSCALADGCQLRNTMLIRHRSQRLGRKRGPTAPTLLQWRKRRKKPKAAEHYQEHGTHPPKRSPRTYGPAIVFLLHGGSCSRFSGE